MVKDLFRFIAVAMLDGAGYDPEVLLMRYQMGIAIWMTPSFLPFF